MTNEDATDVARETAAQNCVRARRTKRAMLVSSGITQKSAGRAGTTARPVRCLKGLAVGRSRARADPLHCEVMPRLCCQGNLNAAAAARTEPKRSRWVRQPFYWLGRRPGTHTEMLLHVRELFNGNVL